MPDGSAWPEMLHLTLSHETLNDAHDMQKPEKKIFKTHDSCNKKHMCTIESYLFKKKSKNIFKFVSYFLILMCVSNALLGNTLLSCMHYNIDLLKCMFNMLIFVFRSTSILWKGVWEYRILGMNLLCRRIYICQEES